MIEGIITDGLGDRQVLARISTRFERESRITPLTSSTQPPLVHHSRRCDAHWFLHLDFRIMVILVDLVDDDSADPAIDVPDEGDDTGTEDDEHAAPDRVIIAFGCYPYAFDTTSPALSRLRLTALCP